MEITVRKEGSATVVSVKGRIDAVTAGEFEKGLSALIPAGRRTEYPHPPDRSRGVAVRKGYSRLSMM
jgi:hypothetical protein